MSEFIDSLPEEKKEQFKDNIMEGHRIARTALQASFNSADTVARSIATAVVMRHSSWLHLSRFLREVQSMVKNLPFDGPKLFAAKTDESLHTLKGVKGNIKISWHLYT